MKKAVFFLLMASAVVSNTVNATEGEKKSSSAAVKQKLSQAIYDNDKDTILEILATGFYPETILGESIGAALHLAARVENPDLIELLLEHGASIEGRDSRGRTPLMVAAEMADIKAAETLLDHGANINAQDKGGTTALRWALNTTRPAGMMRFLLGKKANVNLTDASGNTLLDSVNSMGFTGRQEVQELLIKAGAKTKEELKKAQ